MMWVGVLREVVLLEEIDRPLDGPRRARPNPSWITVADHDEGRLGEDGERLAAVRQPLLQRLDVRGEGILRGLRRPWIRRGVGRQRDGQGTPRHPPGAHVHARTSGA